MDAVKAADIIYSYDGQAAEHRALDKITLTVRRGEFVALLGHNGSGKTTFAKHINVLLPLQSGELTVAGLNAAEEANIWAIRKACGMVFQNPDNQFVSSVVEEDIAFGLENYDTPVDEIPQNVKKALSLVGMEGYEKMSPHMLSGGQKQRVAIAGVFAVDPDIIIFDEATAMLDPNGRREVLDTARRLHDCAQKTVIMISHYVEEAVYADRVVLMHDGKILAEGPPREMLTDTDLMRRTGLLPAMPVRAYYDLKDAGIILPECPLTEEELVESLCRLN